MTEQNPYKSPHQRSPRRTITIVEVGVAVLIVLLLGMMLIPARRSAREPARRNACQNNVRQIALALQNYEAATGSFPPAYTVDADGNRLHSWRTLILPYMEEQELYDSIDFTKAWDDPVNKQARETFVAGYCCPSATHSDLHTPYLAVVGPEFAFRETESRNATDFSDGLGQTVAIIEVDSDAAVPWMSPQDANEESFQSLLQLADADAPRHQHTTTFAVAYADGHTQFVPLKIEYAFFRKLLTIAGGEEISATNL